MPNDFVLAPDFVLDETPQFKTLVTEFETGYEQRRAKWATKVREFKLQFRNRPTADRDTIRTLFLARLGALSSFTWTHPVDGSTITVRFLEDSLTIENIAPAIYNIEFSLREVL